MNCMDLAALLKKRDHYQAIKHKISKAVLSNYDTSFEIEYTHNSTAIEGNTLTLMEIKLLLEDKLSVGGKELREIFEVVNHDKAYGFIRKCIGECKPLDENIVKDVHALLMENIMPGGIYRNVRVSIAGAGHSPLEPSDAYRQIKFFFADMPHKEKELDPISFAAWTHAEFVRIHPFVDGNGRTARLIMNYQLMAAGFLPVSVAKENRLFYFEALEAYAVDGNLAPFSEMIAELADMRLDHYLAGIPSDGHVDG